MLQRQDLRVVDGELRKQYELLSRFIDSNCGAVNVMRWSYHTGYYYTESAKSLFFLENALKKKKKIFSQISFLLFETTAIPVNKGK